MFPSDVTWNQVFRHRIRIQDDCWFWTGYKPDDYGRVWYQQKHELCHRLSYKLIHGLVPKSLNVLHMCDHPTCVRLDHLWLGTQKDNNEDRDRKGRQVSSKGELNGNSILTVELILKIRYKWSLGLYTHKMLSEEYNVSEATIRQIVLLKTWRHI